MEVDRRGELVTGEKYGIHVMQNMWYRTNKGFPDGSPAEDTQDGTGGAIPGIKILRGGLMST